jgi:diaminopimelate decarboxylase
LEVRRCTLYRKAFSMSEIALPAYTLRNRSLAKWVRDHDLAVDVHSGEDLVIAIAAGVHPTRLTVYAEGMSDSELRATVNLAPGRVAVNSMVQNDVLASSVDHRVQGIMLHVMDFAAPMVAIAGNRRVRGFGVNTSALDKVVDEVLANKRLVLVGLHGNVGSHRYDFVSYRAAIGHLITEMSQIRRNHGMVSTRLGLGGGGRAPSGDWAAELPLIAQQIDESLDDACATMRFPRPLIVLSGPGIVGQIAA